MRAAASFSSFRRRARAGRSASGERVRVLDGVLLSNPRITSA
jgi:hypothetical protein